MKTDIDNNLPEDIYIPDNLDDAINFLKANLSAEDLAHLTESSEGDRAMLHLTFGMSLRNNWGLWTETSRLAKWFNTINIHHADDMSGIIIESLYRDLNALPRELEAQVQKYVDHWAKFGDHGNDE